MEIRQKGILYLIATPIGNLEDITLRALRILKEVGLVAAEDTRHTRQLLNHFEISTKLIRYDEHNKESAGQEIIEKLEAGDQIGLVSDAGMPGISDPGSDLVRKAIAAKIRVVPLPGANAGLTALIASGLSTESFFFEGFLPRTDRKQKERLEQLRTIPGTLIFYEAPHRLGKTLQICKDVLGNRTAGWGRELTKKFETFEQGSIEELIQLCNEVEPRGEYVVLIDGWSEKWDELKGETPEPLLPQDRLVELIEQGIAKKEAARQVAKEYNLSRREVYQWTVDESGE